MDDLTYNRVSAESVRETEPKQAALTDGSSTAEHVPAMIMYLRIAKRRKWLMLGAVAIALLLGLGLTLLMTPLYTATTTLEIQRENNRIAPVQGVEPEAGSVDMEFYQTQYSLLQARSLSERVATDLRLYADPNFFELFGDSRTADLLRAPGGAQTARQDNIRRAGALLLDHIQVAPVRLSRLVEVRFTSADPQLSARVLNAWTRDFVQSTLARRVEATSYARQFLEQRLEELRRRLEESERQLVGYASQQRIINIPSSVSSAGGGPNATVTTTERPLVAEDLSALNEQLNLATAARVAAQSRLQGSGGNTPEALQNQAISSLRARRAELASDRARLLSQFEPQYPPVLALNDQIEDLDRSIAREATRVGSTLQSSYQSAAARENALRARVNQLQNDLLNLRGRSIQYNIYQRDVDTNRQLYDGLLQRYKEIGIAGGIGVNNVAIVDPAQVPDRPSSPRLLRNLILAMLLGGLAGVGLAFALEQVDETISNPTDVEKSLAIPLLGTIPKSSGDDPRAELDDRRSGLVEAYLSTQTSLAFTTDHGIPRSFAVTSTRPGEGKSTTTYALALSLARTGRRVLIVDADMRAPSMHHIFEVGNERGLSNYLSGDDNLLPMVVRDLPGGVALLPAGPPPPNAAELLTGDRIGRAIAELSAAFDHVIFDVPPVMGLADTPLIANRVEGVIFIVESHATPSGLARVAAARLRDAQARILGVLLTKFESRRAQYGYGYDYGYGYGENQKAS